MPGLRQQGRLGAVGRVDDAGECGQRLARGIGDLLGQAGGAARNGLPAAWQSSQAACACAPDRAKSVRAWSKAARSRCTITASRPLWSVWQALQLRSARRPW